MYYYLVIATSNKVSINNQLDALFLKEDFILIDDHHLKYKNEIVEFEYLIYSNKSNITYNNENILLFENNIPVTNFYYQTTLENIYFIIEDNLEQKINDIINNE